MITEYINNNMSGFWIAVGFILMASEVLIFGFGTIIFLFAGLAAVLTGLLMMFGVLPETWIAGVASFGICTGVFSALLWKPLTRMQSGSAPRPGSSSDLIGLEFVLQHEISVTYPGSYRYSGIDWNVEIDKSATDSTLAEGQRVAVVSVDAGIFRVVPV
jgi:membrane protein implicated in regulation of membrane protease activity